MPGTSLPPEVDRLINSLLARIERLERQTRLNNTKASDNLWTLSAGALQPKSPPSTVLLNPSGSVLMLLGDPDAPSALVSASTSTFQVLSPNVSIVGSSGTSLGGAGSTDIVGASMSISTSSGAMVIHSDDDIQMSADGDFTLSGLVSVNGSFDASLATVFVGATTTHTLGSPVELWPVETGAGTRYIPLYA